MRRQSPISIASTRDVATTATLLRITHVSVETGHHGIPGRRDGRGGAETLQRETRECVNEPGRACENHYRADAARELQTKERRPELPTRDRPWNEPRQRPWAAARRRPRAQDGNRSFHGSPTLTGSFRPPFMVSRRQATREAWSVMSIATRNRLFGALRRSSSGCPAVWFMLSMTVACGGHIARKGCARAHGA